MVNVSPPGHEHELFMSWAKEQGVRISGVRPVKIQGRGLGIVAERRIEADEELVVVPASALLTSQSISPRFRGLHNGNGLTIHGLLASFLAFGGKEMEPYSIWRATWPSFADFQDSMPILWPLELRESRPCKRSHESCKGKFFPLPPAIGSQWATTAEDTTQSSISGLLAKQEQKMKKDWAIISKLSPGSNFEIYAYTWLIVNTRSFYYELADLNVRAAREDRMVLCPFIDYFNHADHGCDVAFDEGGFTVTSDRKYEVGEEIFTSYGNHSNDFLLVEYGFILDINKWDTLPLDDLILPLIKQSSRHRLDKAGYLGNYHLTPDQGLCHRTQVAVRTQTLSFRNWKRFVAGLSVDDLQDEAKAGKVIVESILEVYGRETEHAVGFLEEAGRECWVEAEKGQGIEGIGRRQGEVLVRRWRQIREMLNAVRKQSVSSIGQ